MLSSSRAILSQSNNKEPFQNIVEYMNKHNVTIDSQQYNAIITSYTDIADFSKAFQYIQQIKQKQIVIEPDLQYSIDRVQRLSQLSTDEQKQILNKVNHIVGMIGHVKNPSITQTEGEQVTTIANLHIQIYSTSVIFYIDTDICAQNKYTFVLDNMLIFAVYFDTHLHRTVFSNYSCIIV